MRSDVGDNVAVMQLNESGKSSSLYNFEQNQQVLRSGLKVC